jgi:hypothetical protein
MASDPPPLRPSYQVALSGRFGPAYLSMFADLGARDIATCSVFHLAVPPGHDVLDITARLRARDVVVLGIRRLAPPPLAAEEQAPRP